ncbi:UDP-N-acetylglucosamine 2-epimerase [Nitrospina watsonii]|uniref:UDP-N,N'-diacetylbacillosamine 2-epimerase (Hydrolyzing) n=1 Tax=Nitrospina watsonii TaxID=1323948 RepID=A0ABN8VXZ7_9BACT|nr:UDP-N-acetylglucosamine 2-epimerase [Nitrospina watsonii]CAI2716998.1 UDP-N,N'-diacetylbacillosamine 2-epimerase (hydrolyzing) [Nitrospina watsonii]
MRKFVYVSGTRADFGLLRSTLLRIHADPELDLSLSVTGMHLSEHYGNTVDEIEAAGLRIAARIPVDLTETSGGAMARALGAELTGMTDALECERPDAVLVLGDRGEQLAGALAAIHLNIPVVHLHGGERSGTVDEPVRHAISKLAHYHFVATETSRERLVRMGERTDRIFITGAPGLDGLKELATRSRQDLCAAQHLDPTQPLALVLFHPVVQEMHTLPQQTVHLMEALVESGMQAVVLMPNADAGGDRIRDVIEQFRDRERFRVVVHMPREEFVSWLAGADVMVGNSSSGIIESASFGRPVVNIGTRQTGRERSGNVIDVTAGKDAILQGIRQALEADFRAVENVYGQGDAGEKIVELLKTIPLDPAILQKSNAY